MTPDPHTTVLSYTIPCHGREADLCQALPVVVAAANVSPPVEIVLVDYACTPPLAETLPAVDLGPGVTFTLRRYSGRAHYHMSHARNLTIRASTGDYVIISGTDYLPQLGYFPEIRRRLAETGATWLVPQLARAMIVCRRDVLVAAGGYDERIEFYGPEDKDLHARLLRRGEPWASTTDAHIRYIPTPKALKAQGYRLPLTLAEMHVEGRRILLENVVRQTRTANDGMAWGAWDA